MAICRPKIMVNMRDEEYTGENNEGLRNLGRHALSGKGALAPHPVNFFESPASIATFYLTAVVLKLGDIRRQPWFSGKRRYPSWIRRDRDLLDANLILRLSTTLDMSSPFVNLMGSLVFQTLQLNKLLLESM